MITNFCTMSLARSLIWTVLVFIAVYLFYRWLLPTPIPGIPYNKEATRSLLGDVASLTKWEKKTGGEIYTWLLDQIHRHKSPIVQVFVYPFGKPWLVVADYVETEDALLRRNDDFEQSETQIVTFRQVVPEHHISFQTNAKFKRHRQMVQDLMTPTFLHATTAPLLHDCFMEAMQLWEIKAQLAQDCPFEAKTDMSNSALDMTWAAFFGRDTPIHQTRANITALSACSPNDVSARRDGAVDFPVPYHSPEFASLVHISESLEIPMQSATPAFSHWLHRQTKPWKKAYALKEKVIREEISKRLRAAEANGGEFAVRCGLDSILRREKIMSEREGKAPAYFSRAMVDEVCLYHLKTLTDANHIEQSHGFVSGGADTSHTALSWSVKFLARYPEVQSKLRAAIFAGFPAAVAEKRVPTAAEIASANIPYLDATEEELIRHSKTEISSLRRTKRDITFLGRKVPKGVDVWFLGIGPSYFEPAHHIPDSMRSPTARAAKSKVGAWNPRDIGDFKPERWLVKDADGNETFDPSAGPQLTFGLGVRGCWGRRMAYLVVKIGLVLMLWNFEFLPVPEHLDGDFARDGASHSPQQCYVRVKKVNL